MDVDAYLKTLPRPVLKRAVAAMKAMRGIVNDSAFLRQCSATKHIETETVSLSFYVGNDGTLNILRISIVDTEADNVIWLVSRQKYEREKPTPIRRQIKRKASRMD